jgi:two-component system, OmpR family, sensor histidine kinase CiaH
MKTSVPLRPALRVATAATAVVGLFYALIVIGILTLVSNRLLHETDGRVAEQLANARSLSPAQLSSRAAIGRDSDDPPVYYWQVSAARVVTAASPGALPFPVGLLHGSSTGPRTAFVDGRDFRFGYVLKADGSRIYAAESLAQPHHVRSLLLMSALVVSPALLAAVFVSAFVIGRSASKPVESSRVRQLEFTADASHELRTPLTVIEAEVGLALTTDRTASGYRDALQRVAGETPRLRKIVEDMLWLARFDSEPPMPQAEIVDLTTVAQQCADRFGPVVASRNIRLSFEVNGDEHPHVAAAPEWLDRLIGVLLDNATRYAKSPGEVVIRVDSGSGHVALTVADDGPGIPVAERPRLFDRFHRIEDNGGQGAGLGLAIADAVVRTTHGRWSVGESALGGARMTVTWPRVRTPSASKLPSLQPSPHA